MPDNPINSGGLDPNKINDILAESLRRQEALNISMGEYLQKLKDVEAIEKVIAKVERQIQEYINEHGDAQGNLTEEKKRGLQILEDTLRAQQALLKEQKELLGETNKWAAAAKSVANALRNVPTARQMFGGLKATGIFQMDKELRNAARSMAISEKSFNKMARHVGNAAERTTMWGVGVKQLAVMQRQYSEEIGRSVQLTEDGFQSLALLSEGVGLGDEFAVGLASEMDKFAISMENTKDLMQETVDISTEMGVNSAAAAKILQNSLRLSQKYVFKGGVKGLTTMANKAARLKLDMDGIAGVADKVFRPEGAIETAALLTTMGGQFSKLGDPMQLMFKARNDFEGFATDIGKATSEFVEFNKETGGFDIKGGLAADRMREISTILGISVEKLQEMAVQQKKIEQVGSVVPVSFDKEDSDLIASMAKWDKGKNEFVISVGGIDKPVKQLNSVMLDTIKQDKQTLEERAEQARTFQENWQDITLQFQQLLLPMAQGLKDGLGNFLKTMNDTFVEGDAYKWMKDLVVAAGTFTKTIAKGATRLLEWSNNTFGAKGTLAAVLAIYFGKNIVTWMANGVALGRGFLATTRGFGGAGGGGAGGGGAGGMSAVAKGRGFSSNFKSAGSSSITKWGGVAMGLMAAYKEFVENREKEMSFGENIARTAAKGIGAGGGAWAGASTGAAIGAVGGPIGIALGGLIGGAIGAWGGGVIGEGVGDLAFGQEVNDGIIKFNPKDKFLQLNDTLIAGTDEGGNKKLAKAMTGEGAKDSIVKHQFEDVNVNININVEGNDDLGTELAKDQAFIRRINEAIQQQISMALGGGKLSPNPKYA